MVKNVFGFFSAVDVVVDDVVVTVDSLFQILLVG